LTAETSPKIEGIETPPLRVAVVAWGLAGAAVCAAMALLEPNLLEEGFPLHVAQRLVGGQHLYRDIFFYTGLLPSEFLALLFRIFGDSIVVARAAVVVLHGITSATTFGLARRAGAGPLAHLAAATVVVTPVLFFPLYSIYFHTTLAMSLSMLAVYAAVRATESTGWAWAAGVLTASVALSKQTVGGTLGLGLLVVLWSVASPKRRVAAVGGFAGGGGAVALVSVLAFALQGTLGQMVTALVVSPLSLHETFHMPFPRLWPPGTLDNNTLTSWGFYLPGLYVLLTPPPIAGIVVFPHGLPFATQLLYATPPAVLVATLVRGAIGRLPAPVWLNGVGLLAASTNLLPRTDWGHLAMVLPTTAVQLVLVAAVPVDPHAPRRSRVLLAASLTAAVLSGALVAGAGLWAMSGSPTFGPRVPLRPVTGGYRAPAVPRVIEYLRTHTRPGEEIFVARQEPLLYFATETQNPTRYEGMLQGFSGQQEEEILKVLPHLRYVVMSELDSPAQGVYSQELPAVYAALERYFRVPDDFPVDKAQWLLVLERGPKRGASAVDLVAARGAAHPWMRDRSGHIRWLNPAALPIGNARFLHRPLMAPMGELGGGMDFSLEVPPHAVFEAGVGLARLGTSIGGAVQEADIRWIVRVLTGQRDEVLQSVELPADPDGERGWEPIEADLSSYSGQRITLRLETVPATPLATPEFAWWGSPRVAVRAAMDGDR